MSQIMRVVLEVKVPDGTTRDEVGYAVNDALRASEDGGGFAAEWEIGEARVNAATPLRGD